LIEVNFFWVGKNFGFLNNIVVKSHLKVGHKPILWLSGERPTNRFWNDIENKMEIKNIDDSNCNINEFLSTGGKPSTASDLWMFYFLYKYGGLYCDLDVFALKEFPNDKWITCIGGNEEDYLSLGVLKAPQGEDIFKECQQKVKKKWGNVKLFNGEYQKFFPNTNPTHGRGLFFPYKWTESYNLVKKMEIPKDCYSISFYTFALNRRMNSIGKKISDLLNRRNEPKNINELNEKWCEKNVETLLGKLWQWLQN